tara:strand:- start:952 stop:1440 length:489 start_codon:yes stop_codon:yes gene_type:complete
MKTQSCKAKGRRLQQQIVEDLYSKFDLGEGDLRSTPMGSGGEDVQMSARAMQLIPFSFEAKNQERLNIWSALEQSEHNCNGRRPVVVIKKNNKKPHAVITWDTFLSLVSGEKQNVHTPPPCASNPTDAEIESLKTLVGQMQAQLHTMEQRTRPHSPVIVQVE